MNQRHTEFFGPDLARGPFGSSQISTTTVAIATALAQLRAPLSRSDDDIRAHADFIREIADRLAPDWAALVNIDVGTYDTGYIPTDISAVTGTFSLLECWLADSVGGGETGTTPYDLVWTSGTVLQTITAGKHYLVVTPQTGCVSVKVGHSSAKTWYWGICRQGRVYYSTQVRFY